jgi:hypothetical protein
VSPEPEVRKYSRFALADGSLALVADLLVVNSTLMPPNIEKGMSGALSNGLGRWEVRLGSKAGDELLFFLAESVDHRCVVAEPS